MDPPTRVDVFRDDRWWPGRLSCWLRWHDGTWRGMCHWTDDQCLKYELWVPADRIRPAA